MGSVEDRAGNCKRRRLYEVVAHVCHYHETLGCGGVAPFVIAACDVTRSLSKLSSCYDAREAQMPMDRPSILCRAPPVSCLAISRHDSWQKQLPCS